MPDPVSSSIEPNVCSLPDNSPEEIEAQMSLSAAHPTANSSQSSRAAPNAPALPGAPPSPAVTELVSRFKAPSIVHLPVEPSLAHAIMNCKTATAAYIANTAATLIAVPETFGFAFLAGAARVVATGTALLSCIEQDEAEQIQDGQRADLAADCRDQGAIPVTTSDHSVACVK
jgi:hypothetical protein